MQEIKYFYTGLAWDLTYFTNNFWAELVVRDLKGKGKISKQIYALEHF